MPKATDNLTTAASLSGALTERDLAKGDLRQAARAIEEGDIAYALRLACRAADTLGPLVAANVTLEDERREIKARHRRIARAERGAATRQRNRALQEAALAAAGIELTRGGVVVAQPSDNAAQ